MSSHIRNNPPLAVTYIIMLKWVSYCIDFDCINFKVYETGGGTELIHNNLNSLTPASPCMEKYLEIEN